MPSTAVPWIAAIAMAAFALFAPTLLNDDTFAHVATGDWIVAHRVISRVDPFSYTFAGKPWIAHEWLAELALAAAYRAASWTGVAILTAIAAATAFFNLARHLGRWLPAPATLLLVVFAAACVAPGLLARPHIMALPFFEAWVAGLFLARSEARAPSWWLLPVMVVWANLHGGFIIGLLLVIPLALEALTANTARQRDVAIRWGAFLAASVGAACLTPHGPAGLLFPFTLLGNAELSSIGEWRPIDFGTVQPFELILVAGLYVALSRGARLAPVRLLILLGLLHMALGHSRHQTLVAVIVPLLLAEPLGAALSQARPARSGRQITIAGLAALGLLIAARIAFPPARPTAPYAALAHVPATFAALPVLNDYAFGSYLAFAGLHPFIDARAELYGEAFMHRYKQITRPDRAALDDLIRDYGVRWTLLTPDNPAVTMMDTKPGWCRFYADDVAIVHAPCR